MPKPSQMIGKYRLGRQLHSGGMANIFIATDVNNGEEFAIKVLHSELVLDVELVMRFVNEAHVLYSLTHPALPRLYDGSLLPGGVYLTLELLGPSLAEWLGRAERPSVNELMLVGTHVASGLAALHSHGIVHRDIKPENILLSLQHPGNAKLIDFGLAKVSAPLSIPSPRPVPPPLVQLPLMPVSTSGSTLLGTWEYMPPEQWRDAKRVDGRADIYSLGIVLYLGLTGRFPFAANSPKGWMSQHLYQDPVPLRSEHMPNPRVRALLMQMLVKDPSLRPSADEVESALQEALYPFGPSAGVGENRC